MSEAKRGPGRPRADSDLDADLERLTREAGPDDVLQFSRYDAGAAEWRYLEQQEPSKVAEIGVKEWAAQRYGGGKIRARLRNRRTSQYGLTRSFTLEGSPRAFSRDASSPEPGAIAASSSSSSSSPSSIAERLALAIAVPLATAAGTMFAKKLLEGPKTDPLLVELISALTADGKRGRGDVDPLALQQLILAAEDRGQRRGETIGELRAEVNAPPPVAIEAGDGWSSVVTTALPAIQELADRYLSLEEKRLERNRPPLALVNPASPASPASPAGSSESSSSSSAASTPAASSSEPRAIPEGIDPTDPLTQLLGSIPVMARRFMAAAAAGGEDPIAYVPLILSKLDERAYETLADAIDRPDLLDVAFRVVPKWGEYRDWFARLFDGIRDSMRAGEEETEETSSGSGEETAA